MTSFLKRFSPQLRVDSASLLRLDTRPKVRGSGDVASSRTAPSAEEHAVENGSALKIYTKGGDGGETTLLGGVRVAKDDPRVAAYGTVDELNAAIGVALAQAEQDDEALADSAAELRAVQEDLFALGARLAATNPDRALRKGTIPEFSAGRVAGLEAWIDRLDADLPTLEAFVLPGGSPIAAQLHVARTVCRRAERKAVGLLGEQPELAEVVVPYLNRLSDLLFTLARFANQRGGRDDIMWMPQRQRDDGK